MGIYNRPSVTHIHRSHLCLADDCLTEHAAAHGRQSNQQAAATVSKHEGTFTEKILGTVFEGEEVRSAKKKVATLHLKKKKEFAQWVAKVAGGKIAKLATLNTEVYMILQTISGTRPHRDISPIR